MWRFSRIGQCGAVAQGIVFCALGLALAAGECRAAAQPLLAPTPLILKDGRIASVAVHVLLFRQGAEELDAKGSAELRELTHAAATDCFLTAQVIGHVGLSEISASDTLGAHRLARARADRVQAALIGGGLPVNGIASVWDWQFMVREPRATIWLFHLTKGEDCEGTPLEPGDAALVASADPSPIGAGAPALPGAGRPAEMPQQAGNIRDATAGGGGSGAGTPAPRVQPPTIVAAADGKEEEPAAQTAVRAAAPAANERAEVAAADVEARPAAPKDEAAPARARGTDASTPAHPKSGPREQAAAPRPAGAVKAEGDTGGKNGRTEATKTARASTAGPKQTPAANQPEADRTEAAARSAAVETRLAARSEKAAPSAADDGRGPSGAGAAAAAGRGQAGVPTVIQPLPALSPNPPASPASSAEAKRAAGGAVVAAAEAAEPSAGGGAPALVITFANNSSYFSPATARELQALARGLEPEGRYRVRLLGAVGRTAAVAGASTPAEAERYNKWLAERRIERVEAWLGENVLGPEVDIETGFLPDDDSRQVKIWIAPAG
jgi:hypothetical protein